MTICWVEARGYQVPIPLWLNKYFDPRKHPSVPETAESRCGEWKTANSEGWSDNRSLVFFLLHKAFG